MTRVILLGPQHEQQTIGSTVDGLGVRGRIATVTAGWQEWESDDVHLQRQLGGRGVNLRLYARAEGVWQADAELRAAHHRMQDRLRALRRLYNRRLAHLADDWIELLDDPGPTDLLDPEREQALDAIRALDRHHLDRIDAIRAEFTQELRPFERSAVVREREEIAGVLAECEAVVVQGGHVALLHNRLRLFGMGDLLQDRTVIACSGGAMALGERVVLFHDSPPWGPGHSEVALHGLGLYSGLVALPHARQRLRLDDPARVSRLVRRLAPDRCVVLEAGSRLDWDGAGWRPVHVERLESDGRVGRWEQAA